MNDDQTNDQVVTMSIRVDDVVINPQTETSPIDTISPINPQVVGIGNSCVSATGHVMDNTTTPNKCTLCGYMANTIPQDDIAKAIENAPEIKEPDPGRPCEFCQDKENILTKTRQYIESGKSSEKPKMMFLIELAMILGKHRETIMNWAKKETDDGSLKHPEFFDMIKSVEEMQELRLQQRVLGRYNPTGAIFLLKTKHGYIETDKKILAGDKNEPLQVEIIEERKLE